MGFSQALSGMSAASQQLDAIGNNIANSQTTGFKSSSVQFADVYASSKIGLGTSVAGVLQDFGNGTLETTDRDLDLGISGDGFFRFQAGDTIGYSRNGQLTMTTDGYLANAQGAYLTGYNVQNFNSADGAAATVPTGGQPEVIQLPSGSISARATSSASAAVDLDSSDDVPTVGTFDPDNASSYNYATSNTVYDSQGNSYNLQMYFIKNEASTSDGDIEGANTWTVETRAALGANNAFPKSIDDLAGSGVTLSSDPASASGGNGAYSFSYGGSDYVATITGATATKAADGSVTGYTGGSINYTAVMDTKTLTFDDNGRLVEAADNYADPDDHADAASQVAFGFNPQNGAGALDFTFDFSGSTQTEQSYATSSPNQDGYASGQLVGISIDNDGTIVGSYSNDQSVDLGRVALADFANTEGLQPIGDNLWQETTASGQAVMGVAGSGSFGSLQAGTLEASNVDLSTELVNLIIAQRNFQANSNTIKTQDEVLQTVVNLR